MAYRITFALLGMLCILHAARSQATVQAVNLVSPCTWGSEDSVDIGLDGDYDITVTWIGGIDNVQSYIMQLPGNYRFAYPVLSGEPYGPFWNSALLTQTSIGCFWSTFWQPNTGLRYVGFKRIDSPTDTTYGWIEADFYGDPGSCTDTVKIIQLAYQPDVPLPAGSVGTGIATIERTHDIRFDAQQNDLVIDNRRAGSCTLEVGTGLGQQVLARSIAAGSLQQIPLGTLAPGSYTAVLRNSTGVRSVRFVR